MKPLTKIVGWTLLLSPVPIFAALFIFLIPQPTDCPSMRFLTIILANNLAVLLCVIGQIILWPDHFDY